MKLGWKLEFPKEIGSSPQWNKIPIKSVAGVTEDASSHKNSVTFEPSFSKKSQISALLELQERSGASSRGWGHTAKTRPNLEPN